MSKTHLIADETIGGIEREYVEVDREAVVGDYVVIIGNEMGHLHEIGAIVKVDEVDEGMYADGWWISDEVDKDYLTLEPTDIVHIDGQRYRMVERKAEVDEKVLIVDNTGKPDYNGRFGEVMLSCDNEGISVNVGDDVEYYPYVFDEEYRVLVPLSMVADDDLLTVDTTQASPEVIDLLANLTRRVTSLEQQLRDTQTNVERQAEEHEGLAKLVKANTDDIVTLDERTQSKDAESVFVKALVELAKEARR